MRDNKYSYSCNELSVFHRNVSGKRYKIFFYGVSARTSSGQRGSKGKEILFMIMFTSNSKSIEWYS